MPSLLAGEEVTHERVTSAQAQAWLDRKLKDPAWVAKLREGQAQMNAQADVKPARNNTRLSGNRANSSSKTSLRKSFNLMRRQRNHVVQERDRLAERVNELERQVEQLKPLAALGAAHMPYGGPLPVNTPNTRTSLRKLESAKQEER